MNPNLYVFGHHCRTDRHAQAKYCMWLFRGYKALFVIKELIDICSKSQEELATFFETIRRPRHCPPSPRQPIMTQPKLGRRLLCRITNCARATHPRAALAKPRRTNRKRSHDRYLRGVSEAQDKHTAASTPERWNLPSIKTKYMAWFPCRYSLEYQKSKVEGNKGIRGRRGGQMPKKDNHPIPHARRAILIIKKFKRTISYQYYSMLNSL